MLSSTRPAERAAADGSPSQGADALWSAFVSADNAADFCRSWLSLQCRQIGEVRAALLLLEQGGGTFVPAAVWPSEQTDVTYLAPGAQQCLGERRGLIQHGQAGAVVLVAYPVEIDGRLQGAVVLDLHERADAALQGALRDIHWGVGWLDSLFLRRQGQDNQRALERARAALDVLGVAAEQSGLPVVEPQGLGAAFAAAGSQQREDQAREGQGEVLPGGVHGPRPGR